MPDMNTNQEQLTTSEIRVIGIMQAAKRQGHKVTDRWYDTGNLCIVVITRELCHGLEMWYFDFDLKGRVTVREYFNGIAQSGRRVGQEISLRSKTSLRNAESVFEVLA